MGYVSSFGRRIKIPPEACPYRPRHLPVVTSRRRPRDLFRLTCWVRCWHCDLALGPYDREGAEQRRRHLDRLRDAP